MPFHTGTLNAHSGLLRITVPVGLCPPGALPYPWKEGSDETGDGVVVDDSGIILGLRLLDGAERK